MRTHRLPGLPVLSAAAMLAALPGCGLGGLSPYAGADTGTVQADIWIDAIDPSWGPTAGDTRVVIRGGGFEGEAVVSFGGAELDVTRISDEELVVYSPTTSVETAVDVTVRSDLGEVVLPAAFTYSDSGPPETGGDDSGGGSTGDGGGGGGGGTAAGQVSGLVEYWYEVVACPTCFGLTEQLSVGGSAIFHDPVGGSWLDWLPAKGSCTTEGATQLTSASVDVGDFVYMESGSTSIGLRRTTAKGRTVYTATGLGQADYVRNADWDVTVSSGPWGGFESNGVLRTVSDGFDAVQPAAILEDGGRAFSASIRASSASFTWAPAYIADSFVTTLGVYRAADGSYIGQVTCHTDDTGSVTVPSTMLSGFPSGSLLAIYMYRYQIEEGINPVDGSTIEGVTSFGLIGTGTLR